MIRRATPADRPAIEAIIRAAYTPYIARMGIEPLPMLDDYAAHIAAGQVEVIEDGAGLLGLVVLVHEEDALLLDNIALADRARGRGYGGLLIAHAEATARAAGLARLRLVTNVLMTENQAIYAHLGFRETHRATREGRHGVFMEKPIPA